MLQYQTVEPATLELIKKLQSLDELQDARLVGGTALALQIGHRKSVDIDLFMSNTVDVNDLLAAIQTITNDVVLLSSSRTMRFLRVNSVKVDVVAYPYKWIDEPVSEDGITLASVKDIAAMKISAITNRGTKKDFIDLYFLLQQFTFQEIIELYKTKYPDAVMFTTLKSLAYFDDAEPEPMPYMLKDLSWEQVKSVVSGVV